MKHSTIYDARSQTLNLIAALENEPNSDHIDALKSCLNYLNEEFLGLNKTLEPPFDALIIQTYRQTAKEVYAQFHLLVKQSHRIQLESICLVLILLAQKMEFLSEPKNINKFQKKLIPLINDSEQFGTTILKPLCQQSSVYLAGHKGICALATKEWLADDFMKNIPIQNQNVLSENFVKAVQFNNEELNFLYEVEEKNKRSALTFFIVGPTETFVPFGATNVH